MQTTCGTLDLPTAINKISVYIAELIEVVIYFLKIPSYSTAVYALNGHAVMGYNWYDVDPDQPEAATTFARIYNRTMRRWERMYLTNRFNSILYFGDVMEGEEIILTLFETDNSSSSIIYFTFYDIEEDSYQWHTLASNDRG